LTPPAFEKKKKGGGALTPPPPPPRIKPINLILQVICNWGIRIIEAIVSCPFFRRSGVLVLTWICLAFLLSSPEPPVWSRHDPLSGWWLRRIGATYSAPGCSTWRRFGVPKKGQVVVGGSTVSPSENRKSAIIYDKPTLDGHFQPPKTESEGHEVVTCRSFVCSWPLKSLGELWKCLFGAYNGKYRYLFCLVCQSVGAVTAVTRSQASGWKFHWPKINVCIYTFCLVPNLSAVPLGHICTHSSGVHWMQFNGWLKVSGCLELRQRGLCTYWIGGRMGPRVGMDTVWKRYRSVPSEIQTTASRLLRHGLSKKNRQCTYKATLRCVRVTIVVVEKK